MPGREMDCSVPGFGTVVCPEPEDIPVLPVGVPELPGALAEGVPVPMVASELPGALAEGVPAPMVVLEPPLVSAAGSK